MHLTLKIDVETGELVKAQKDDKDDAETGPVSELKMSGEITPIPVALFVHKASPGCITYIHHGQYYTICT